ncbi:MAG: hypothetical protein ACI92E_002944 [Oceanicoccus sp.]|jgi:hypothetical protein
MPSTGARKNMSFFEFIMVLIGLVGAISISVILTYLGYVTRNWDFVKNPALFLLLTVWMVFNVIGHISGIWAYRFVDLEIHFSVFVVIAPVIFFTMAVTTLIPIITQDDEAIDLDAIYFRSSRSVFFFLAVHEFTALAADYLPGVTGAPPAFFMLTMVLIFLIGMVTKRKDVHYGLLALVIASQAIPPLLQVFKLD